MRNPGLYEKKTQIDPVNFVYISTLLMVEKTLNNLSLYFIYILSTNKKSLIYTYVSREEPGRESKRLEVKRLDVLLR